MTQLFFHLSRIASSTDPTTLHTALVAAIALSSPHSLSFSPLSPASVAVEIPSSVALGSVARLTVSLRAGTRD